MTTAACTQGVDTGFIALGYGKVAVLGVVQGVTELLPISSTAHMRVVPALLGWPDPGSAFSAAMQLAALGAVITYFWSDVKNLMFGATGALIKRDFADRNFLMAAYIVLATIPIVIGGLFLKDALNACGSPLRGLAVIGTACIVMAILLAIAEITARHIRRYEDVTLRDAMIVGLAQVGALIPGVSRSGSTLTAALFLGFKREEAARFSFLLGLPAIAAAGLKELWVLQRAGLSAEGWSILGVGLLVAALSAFVAIFALMRVMERFSSWPFVFYRAAMGGLLLTLVYQGILA
jgi:undecaprenyl-diphosphatase